MTSPSIPARREREAFSSPCMARGEDGADYAKEAAARGAVCVVTEHAAEGVPCVLVPDAHEAAAKLAARWYGEPAGRMTGGRRDRHERQDDHNVSSQAAP